MGPQLSNVNNDPPMAIQIRAQQHPRSKMSAKSRKLFFSFEATELGRQKFILVFFFNVISFKINVVVCIYNCHFFNCIEFWICAAIEFGERLSYFGIATSLILYLTKVIHQDLKTAAKSVNCWSGVTTLMPLLGGFIADAYLGRFWTVLVSSIVYLLVIPCSLVLIQS